MYSLNNSASLISLQEHTVSAKLLADYDPAILNRFSPRCVFGDGNCFYRAIALAMFGNQDYHLFIRAMTAFYIIDHRDWYDIESPLFVTGLHETCVQTPSYRSVVLSALSDGTYAELVHIFATSSVFGVPIQSYCISGTHGIADIHPYTIRIENNNFICMVPSNIHEVAVMWTVRKLVDNNAIPEPNHFVMLAPQTSQTNDVIDDITTTAMQQSAPDSAVGVSDLITAGESLMGDASYVGAHGDDMRCHTY